MGNAESENPYEIGESGEAVAGDDGASGQRSPRSPTDPSVTAEPWMSTRAFLPDPSDTGSPGTERPGATTPEHSVWDEPRLSSELSGNVPDDAVTWFRHHRQQSQNTSAMKAWLVTFLIVLVAGPCAILGTLISGQSGDFPVVYISVIGPTVEGLLKLAMDGLRRFAHGLLHDQWVRSSDHLAEISGGRTPSTIERWSTLDSFCRRDSRRL